MGNMMYDHVKRMHWEHHVIPVKNTYIISAICNEQNVIKAKIHFDLFDLDFKRSNTICVISMYIMIKRNSYTGHRKLTSNSINVIT